LDNLKSLIKSSSVFDLPPTSDKKLMANNYVTAPSQNGAAAKEITATNSVPSLPTMKNNIIDEDTRSRRMS
jgi:hypothetical protein